MCSVIFLILFAISTLTSFGNGSQAAESTQSTESCTSAATHTTEGPVAACTLGFGKESHQVINKPPLWPYQTYRSSPFNPPELQITANGQSLAPGLLFLTPSDFTPLAAAKDIAPIIMTVTGQLVWNGPIVNATNLRVACYKDKPILTYWSGLSTSGGNVGHGYGNITFLDTSYNEILTVCPQLGLVTPGNIKYPCEADFHESFLTDRDTLLVTAYNATEADLSSIGGPVNGWVFDCLFFEINPENGNILFQWSALEHVPVDQTKAPLRGAGRNQSLPFDYFHINSVVNIGNAFLVNSRHVWTVYLVDAEGDISWTLQGDTGGDFGTLPAKGHFSWQHYARPHKVTNSSINISFFNNFNALGIQNGTNPSNGLELHLPLPPSKSTPPLALEYLSDPADPIYGASQGSNSFFPNGNRLLDYGEIAVLKEFGPHDPSGKDVRWTARFGADNLVQSYRGFKSEWHGIPKTKPDVVIQGGSGCNKGYVSWNGATGLQGWDIFQGAAHDQLVYAGRIGYKGFETEFTVAQSCIQVAAVVHGAISSRSNVVCI